MPTLDTGEATLYYEVQGTGDPLLLISGTTQDANGWLLHLPWLSSLRTVIAFDNRGAGRSSYAERDYAPADLARDASALLKHAGLGPADVLGYSLGGTAAQELALSEPSIVRSLVLLSTWARSDAWLTWKLGTWALFAQRLSRAELYDALALDIFTHRWFADSAQVDMFRTVVAANPYPQRPDGLVRQVRADQAHDALERLGAISCPALVIVGEEDVLTPPRYSEELAKAVPGAELRTIPAAGHGALYERAEDFRRIVTGWLKER